MEGVAEGQDQRKTKVMKSAGSTGWTGLFVAHFGQIRTRNWLSIDPPIGRGFTRSLVPIMANSSHQRLGPTALMSRLWRVAWPSLYHGFIFQLRGSFINPRVSCSLGCHQSRVWSRPESVWSRPENLSSDGHVWSHRLVSRLKDGFDSPPLSHRVSQAGSRGEELCSSK